MKMSAIKYTTKEDIFDHIAVGMTIRWVDHLEIKNPEVHTGVVTAIEECEDCDLPYCYCMIGIDGEPPDCFMNIRNETFIISIEDDIFIYEEEFKV